MNIRKITYLKESRFHEAGHAAQRPTTISAGIAIIKNPMGKAYQEDLKVLFDLGQDVAEMMMEPIGKQLERRPESCGKAAIVGVDGDVEHGSAVIHPRVREAMNATLGGSRSFIPSNVKIGEAGSSIDVPLIHIDDIWSYNHFDTFTVSISDAPRPDEILIAIVIADGERLNARSGKAPAHLNQFIFID